MMNPGSVTCLCKLKHVETIIKCNFSSNNPGKRNTESQVKKIKEVENEVNEKLDCWSV